ncbi:MAG: transporter substrate-binding domain-containing protein [Nitrospinales bacterium]
MKIQNPENSRPAARRLTALFFLALGLLAGCGGDPQTGGSKNKPVVVAVDATLIPMAFTDKHNKLSGFEVDLIRQVAREAGFDIKLVNVEWAGLFGGLVTRKFDAVISSVTILEERKKRMAFSIPYLRSGVAMVVRRQTRGIETLEDVKKANGIVGAHLGTTAWFLIKKDPQIRAKGYQQYGHAITDLVNGKIDAVVGESSGTLYYQTHEKELFQKIKMVGETMTKEYYGIVLRKNDTELMEKINRALRRLLEDGTIRKLHDKWRLGKAASVPENVKPPKASSKP